MTPTRPNPATIFTATHEDHLLASLTQAAAFLNLLSYHTKDSRRSAEGFPDLVIPKPPTLFLWELKRETEQPTTKQAAWLDALQRCTRVHAALIRPSNYDHALILLQNGPDLPETTEQRHRAELATLTNALIELQHERNELRKALAEATA